MPKKLLGLVCVLCVFSCLFASRSAYAKGLRTEELGNSEKERIASLTKEIRDTKDGDVAFSHGIELIKINHVTAFEALKALYQESSETTRAKIVKAIGMQRNEGVIDAPAQYWEILELALDNGTKELSAEIVSSLARLESEAYFDKVIEKIKAKNTSRIALDNVIRVLSSFEKASSGSLIQSTSTLGKRLEAIKALAKPEDGKFIIKALGSYLCLEFAKVEALEKWWQENKAKPIAVILDDVRRRQKEKNEASSDATSKTRMKLVAQTIQKLTIIRKHNKQEAIKEYMNILKDADSEPEVLAHVIKELGQLKKDLGEPVLKEINKHLLKQLISAHIQCRLAAIEALGDLNHKDALGEVAKLLKAKRVDERLEAVKTIAKLGGDKAARELLNALETENDRFVRSEIIKNLGLVGLPVAIEPLVKTVAMVADNNSVKLPDALDKCDALINVVDALGNILKSENGTDEKSKNLAIEYMLAMLAVNKPEVQYAAIYNLGIAKAEKATGVLVDILNNKETDPGIRKEAAVALGEMPKPGQPVLDALYANLKDKSKEVPDNCMRALRNIAGLNGSKRKTNLPLLSDLTVKLSSEKAYEQVRSLLKNLPEEADLQPADKKNKDLLYELRGALAESLTKASSYKAAIIELQKVVTYFKEPKDKVLKYREMLACAYDADNQTTKAIDEYERMIKMVKPPQSDPYWQENLRLIKKIDDNLEKAKRVQAALKLSPPDKIKTDLETLRQELTQKNPKKPKTP